MSTRLDVFSSVVSHIVMGSRNYIDICTNSDKFIIRHMFIITIVKVFIYVVVDVRASMCEQTKHCSWNKQLFNNSASHSHHCTYYVMVIPNK